MSEDHLLVQWDGPVLRLTFNRPKAGNSVTSAMVRTLRSVLAEAPERPEVRVVAVTAVGKDFCTGVDLVEANARSDVRPRVGNHERRIDSGVNQLVREFADVQLPVVAGVRGYAAGLGNSLALLSDHVVASTTARFWTPFTARGFSPDSGSTYLLPRLVGLPRAKEMILLGRPVEAAKAEAWGMVNEVVDDAELEVAVERAVGEYAVAATVGVGIAKQLLRRNLDVDLGAALTNEAYAVEVSLRSRDFKEGITAFGERRPPRYTGG